MHRAIVECFGMSWAVGLLLGSASVQAVPAALTVEFSGFKAAQAKPAPEVDHSMVRFVTPLKAMPRAKPLVMPMMAVLGVPGSGASQSPAKGKAEVVFKGMRFQPNRLVVTEGMQIRLIN